MIMNSLIGFSNQDLDSITSKIFVIKEERRKARYNELKENFEKAWRDLEKEGIEICYSCDGEPLQLDQIEFDY